MEHPVGAGVPGALQQFVAQLFRLLRLAVGTDHGAQARFADVGMREADEHRRRQHALRLQRDAALLQRFVGFGVRALAHHVRQHGLVAPAHDGLDLALERAHDDVGRAQPGGVDVHVRIGMEAADDGGVPDDVVVEVGVHVQRHRHRRRRIDLAQAAQQVALGVFHALGHHGAVQVQQDGVEAAALDLVQHQPAQAFVCLGAGRPLGQDSAATGSTISAPRGAPPRCSRPGRCRCSHRPGWRVRRPGFRDCRGRSVPAAWARASMCSSRA